MTGIPGREEFRRSLEEIFADEQQAATYYGEVATTAPNAWMAHQLELMRQDEARHAWTTANMMQLLGWWPPRQTR